jgi:hypothetical protein
MRPDHPGESKGYEPHQVKLLLPSGFEVVEADALLSGVAGARGTPANDQEESRPKLREAWLPLGKAGVIPT